MSGATPAPDPLVLVFRRERGRIVSALTRVFGLHNLGLAEDVAQDAIVRALETWKLKGVPDNPAAWLMTAAKRKALDVLRRERTARTFAPDLTVVLSTAWSAGAALDQALSDEAVSDEVLRLMFSCCHPQLAPTSQVALVLQLICGFGLPEIAHAFLVGEVAMQKRLARAKATLTALPGLPELTPERVRRDLDAIAKALYLLFNEGYHGAHPEVVVRQGLTDEARRLATLLSDHPLTAGPETLALSALMDLHAARMPSRLRDGELVPLSEQDRSRWDRPLMARALATLERAATGGTLTPWHLEAAIAAEHALAPDYQATSWRRIVGCYDLLMRLAPGPVVALNRAIALGEAEGPEAGLAALDAIDARALPRYPFLPAARAELLRRADRIDAARAALAEAISLARSPAEGRYFERRLTALPARHNVDA